MNPERRGHKRESIETTNFTPPTVELFSDPSKLAEAWPEQIASNESFIEQVEARHELNERLDAVLSCLPQTDVPLQEALEQGQLTEKQATDLYESLNGLLDDPDYRRAVLYVPFEFLPNTAWAPTSAELKHATERFRATYLAAWNSLLNVHDVRANFVDGDIPEAESRVADVPRVVKAAHLIPKLVENGLMKTEDAIKLMEINDDETLKQSIADALPVLADLGLLHDTDLALMSSSEDRLVRETANQIIASNEHVKETENVETKKITPHLLQKKLKDEFDMIDAEEYHGVTKKRTAWLKRDNKRKVIESVGADIETAIASKTLSAEMMTQFIARETSAETQQALVYGIRKAVESVARSDRLAAQELYALYREALLSLWEQAEPGIRAELTKTFCHFRGLGLVADEQLDALDIAIPDLAGLASENLKTIQAELREIKDIASSVESNPELSRSIYPVVLVFGSRVKGYGAPDADIDVGVFVRPDTPPGERGTLQASLKNLFAHEKIRGEVVEFWLDETDDGLAVRDTDEPDNKLGESSWTHVLFGAAWEGDAGAIKELREKLLVPYLYDNDKKIDGRKVRGAYIEQLERDALQYRLMHTGYDRFNPPSGGLRTLHSNRIDGQSAFWDSGYRRTATKLFASRVFLPMVANPKK